MSLNAMRGVLRARMPLALLALVLLACAACAPTPAQPTPPPAQQPTPPPVSTPVHTAPAESTAPPVFVYDKYSMDSYTRDYVKPDPALYRLLFDAVDRFDSALPLTGTPPSEEQVLALSAAIFARFEFNYVNSVLLAPDGGSLLIRYRDGITEEQAQGEKDAFRRKVEYLLGEVVHPEKTELENVTALYEYFSACTYDETAENVGCYGIMVNSQGICTGYAYALRYLLDQIGVPSHLAFSEDESHVWNLVALDGNFYHCDATWESLSRSTKPSMDFFGMDDTRRRMDFSGWYGGGNSSYPRYDLPRCTDRRFAALSGIE
ncbi:MAG: hypothetical protein RRY53_03745 [Pseudoflavonifractor sp.]